MKLLDRDPLFAWLQKIGMPGWANDLRSVCEKRFASNTHGTLPEWSAAWNELPSPALCQLIASGDAVGVQFTEGKSSVEKQDANFDLESVKRILMRFHPWRKGPFDFLGLKIDTEWRSNLKWARIAQEVDFQGTNVLDIGCGNGYYGWKMLDAGASFVLGCDPFLLYVMQFEVFRRYTKSPEQHLIVPIADHELPEVNFFDTTLSMGVLYHRTSPIDHLQTLSKTLRPGGELVLETLVLDSNAAKVLVPEGRYAKMRNVWFIPSLSMLEVWLKRTGFGNIRVLDVAATTSQEQRSTAWMHFESLADFLDPHDSTKTIEGYPAPIRAVLTAKKR